MTFSQQKLHAKAAATGDLLIHAIFEAKLIEAICETYDHVCRDEKLAHLRLVPKELGDDDLKRLAFEIICFAAFIIMSQEVSKHVVPTRTARSAGPDAEGIRYFNGRLLDRLVGHLERAGFSQVRGVVPTTISPEIEFGVGEALNATTRIHAYVKTDSHGEAAKLFSHFVAHAIDPDRYAALTIIGMNSVGPIVDLTRIVLKAAFKSREGG